MSARPGSAAIASHTRATPGVYASAQALASRTRAVERISILPPRWSAKTGSTGRSVAVTAHASEGVDGATIVSQAGGGPMRRGGQTPSHDLRHDVTGRDRTDTPTSRLLHEGCRARPTSPPARRRTTRLTGEPVTSG